MRNFKFTPKAKREIIATLLRARKHRLANAVAGVETIARTVMSKLPKDTELFHKGLFSQWDGKIAAVYAPNYSTYSGSDDFDVLTMARKYIVHFVNDGTGKPTSVKSDARSDWSGLIGVSYQDVGGNFFRVSTKIGSLLDGEFLNAKTFWVQAKLTELYPGEVRDVKQHLDNNGWVDVSDAAIPKTFWKKVFNAKSWDDLYDIDYDKTTALMRIVGDDDDAYAKFRSGVYAMTKKWDRFRYIIKGPDSLATPAGVK